VAPAWVLLCVLRIAEDLFLKQNHAEENLCSYITLPSVFLLYAKTVPFMHLKLEYVSVIVILQKISFDLACTAFASRCCIKGTAYKGTAQNELL